MRALAIALLILLPASALAQDAQPQPLPRTLTVLYDSEDEYSPRHTFIHRFLEMPANHLGYRVAYHNIRGVLPKLGPEVIGVIVWFPPGTAVTNPSEFLDWLAAAQAGGKKVLLLENIGISDKQRKDPAIMDKLNLVLGNMGLRDDNRWYPLTYIARILDQDMSLTNFERAYGPVLQPFGGTHVLPGRATTHLRVSTGEDDEPVDLIAIGPGGGYVAEGYAIFVQDIENPRVIQWYINPFNFLHYALEAPFAPVPDTTTLDGRRIFYSHIDGDGWNNISEIPQYQKTGTLAAEVIRKEILEPYRDFAFNVGLITADIDTKCYGFEASEKVARAIFMLPNVEPSSHTHSHPLFWRWFANYHPEKEKPYLSAYPPRPADTLSVTDAMRSAFNDNFGSGGTGQIRHGLDSDSIPLGRNDETDAQMLAKYYTTPRSYACGPFDIDKEITGSAEIINSISPPGKTVKLIQWSGDTSPYEGAIAAARKAGFYNINGGDSRFDREYPSYAWVAPIGFTLGNEQQIYSSNSNENTYTNLWTGRFFGFRYLQTTVENTEHPHRVHPFNIYFHIFSGQKQASLDAVKENLNYARQHPIIPITASHYAAIANGFFTSKVIPRGDMQWDIHDRGELQTFRFDDAEDYGVDLAASKGVMGYKYYQSSLYVTFDPAATETSIKLINKDKMVNDRDESFIPYIIDSRWVIKNLLISKKSLTFGAQGYGTGEMLWHVSPESEYSVSISRGEKKLFEGKAVADANGQLSLGFGDVEAIEPVTVSLEKK